jgi:hypothetical protein
LEFEFNSGSFEPARALADETWKLERTLSGHIERAYGLTKPLFGVFTPLSACSYY